jgi:glycosyltransferase involved in cell wall biosynthesis
MKLAVNASRARSGGAKVHLIGILTQGDPTKHGFEEVHVWSYSELLDLLPNRPWLFKHCVRQAAQPMWRQLWWERFILQKEVRAKQCDILLNVDAASVCRFRPYVSMSRDMLSYEPGEIDRYGWSTARLRLLFKRHVQNRSLRGADGSIFLTRYAAHVIQQSCGQLRHFSLIPHGVGKNFQEFTHTLRWPSFGERPIRLLYISNADLYKHQWMVVRAVEQLRSVGFNVTLILVGGGSGPAQEMLRKQMELSDPRGEFVTQHEFVLQAELPGYMAEADIFIFASSCENMPNTLLEAMAAGMPIACSRRGPMPEVLEDGGVYFDPEIPTSIASALQKLIDDSHLRKTVSLRAKILSARFSWERCARETWSFLAECYKPIKF